MWPVQAKRLAVRASMCGVTWVRRASVERILVATIWMRNKGRSERVSCRHQRLGHEGLFR
jgi:hypothetical protein